jgi:hypothetical protein
MEANARLRSTVQLRENPAGTAPCVESLDAASLITILEDQGAWLKIKSGQKGSIPGWVPRDALTFFVAETGFFPEFALASGQKVLSVPQSLPVAQVKSWLNSPGQPGWLSHKVWGQLAVNAQQAIVSGIQDAIQQRKADWDAWQERLSAEGRTDTARVDEWQCLEKGGMDVWSVRAERIFSKPAEKNSPVVGWVVESDILRWTGQVKRNEAEPKYKTWYEVRLYKQNRQLNGWFKGDLLDPYYHPTAENDPALERNADNQFCLTTPLLRLPADQEFTDAMNAGRSAYQYIDIFNVLGVHKVHYNLCGELCAATLAGQDIIPFLKEWKKVYPNATGILRSGGGTGLGDIKSMLDTCRLAYEEYRYSPSISPVSPARIKAELDKGKMALAGVGIFKRNGRLCGSEKDPKTTTRHWVIVEDIRPVGSGGWVRLYNPFFNREETYSYNLFIQSHGQFPLGLWVTP